MNRQRKRGSEVERMQWGLGVGVVMTAALSVGGPGCECRLEVGCSVSGTFINIPPPEWVNKTLKTEINEHYT